MTLTYLIYLIKILISLSLTFLKFGSLKKFHLKTLVYKQDILNMSKIPLVNKVRPKLICII